MKLFPGTLNVDLRGGKYPTPKNALLLERKEYKGDVSVYIIECRIFGRRAFILRPFRESHPQNEHQLEIATDIKLRDAYQLNDDDEVTVEVPPFVQN